MIADTGLGANRLGCIERMLEQPVQDFTQAAGIMRLLPGLLQLSQYLGFTDDQ